MSGAELRRSVQFARPGSDGPLFDAVFALGESQSQFLGMLTPAAWREYASKGTILAAVDARGANSASSAPGGTSGLLGYAAYRLPRNEVVLAHLVVAPSARRGGVARALVEELSTRYAGRNGMSARCRRDFPANGMWPTLGFVARGDRAGRSAQGHPLTDWWRDFGHPDLMTWEGPTATTISVVTDANIFIDLHGGVSNRNAARTRTLLNEVLDGRIELLVTPELHNELDRNDDPAVRRRLQSVVESYPRLCVSQQTLDVARDALVASLGRAPRSAQDRSDPAHVAYAAAAGVPAVVTRDMPALRRLAAAAELVGVRLVTPEELVVWVDEAESAPSYTPSALLGTGYRVTEAGASDQVALGMFLEHGAGERKTHYENRLRELAAGRPGGSHRRLYLGPDREPLALLGCASTGSAALDVTVLRMRPNALQATLAAQVASSVRALAAEYHATVIRMTDPHPNPLMYQALLADGFRADEAGPVAMTLDSRSTIAELPDRVAAAAEALTEPERRALQSVLDSAASLSADSSPAAVAAVERQLRPVRIVNAPLPSWLVPIRPTFAAQLFGYPDELFPRTDALGISIEHVYYRKGKSGEAAPGRIVWYVSGKNHGELIACSDLVEVFDGPPDEQWRRYRRLGVYTRDQVRESANARGAVRALRVVNTQLFPTRVSLERLRDLAKRHRQTVQLQSPWRLSAGLYADIMEKGHRGT